jgi:hypothetical protein
LICFIVQLWMLCIFWPFVSSVSAADALYIILFVSSWANLCANISSVIFYQNTHVRYISVILIKK